MIKMFLMIYSIIERLDGAMGEKYLSLDNNENDLNFDLKNDRL